MNYLVTAIQYNAVVNKTLLRNMQLFADNHDVQKIYLFVMPGKHKDETLLPTYLLDDERIEFISLGKEGIKLNNNLKLFDHKILASMVNPLTGMNLKLHREYSYILPSPKIRYESLPNTSSHARFLATTGALTYSNYKLHTAQGVRASLEHQMGFAYVKVKSNRLFDLVQVEALKNGNFHYLREHYKGGKVHDDQPEALVWGDLHVGDTCPKAQAASIEQIEQLKPKRVFLHDVFNGHSVNHHERSNNLSKASLWRDKIHVLEEEVEQCLKELNYLAYKFPDVKFYVVESNHDLFLTRFIGTENFLEDGCNSVFACRMFVELSRGTKLPTLQLATQLVGKVAQNVIFLDQDAEMRVKGKCLSIHGHNGVNGARGSGKSYSNYNLQIISGHEHSPRLHVNGMVVGTMTRLKLPYTKGPSSWGHANGLLYSSGKYALLSIHH
jgi:hypothetical protein